MKHIIVNEPVDYIEFEDGTKIKYDKLYARIEEMLRVPIGIFDLRDAEDRAVFKFLESRLTGVGSRVGYISDIGRDTKPRIFWNHRDEFIYRLLDDLMGIVGKQEETAE